MNNSNSSFQDEIFIRDKISKYTGHSTDSIKVEKIRNLLFKLKDQLRPKVNTNILLGEKQGLIDSIYSENLIKDIEKITQALSSLVFRIAVIGEFSKGKSTLLNAIIGEEIQPSRMIPCSANINILKYGKEQKVIVRNKDGSQEEIGIDEYKNKAIMPIQVAIGSHSDAIANSDIEEIIYEHPGLELFKNGIELIDSPGLNQHPDVERITQRIIKDIDAVIFVTSCLQPLTQNERQLIDFLKIQLNEYVGKAIDQPAENIFIIVNFIDLIRTPEDRQQIALLFEELTKGKNPVLVDKNRIHFISAQKSIDSIINKSEDEYLKDFRNFIEAINDFLNQRGYSRIQQPCNKFKQTIREYLKQLQKKEGYINNDLKQIADEINRIKDQIGHAENCQKEIVLEAQKIVDSSSVEIIHEWKKWSDEHTLAVLIKKESIAWSSNNSPIFKQKEIIKDYVLQLNSDLKNLLENWWNEQTAEIIKPKSQEFDDFINQKLQSVRLRVYGGISKSKDIFNYQKYQINAALEDNFFGIAGVRGGVILGSIVAILLELFGQANLFNVIAAGVVITIISSVGFGSLDVDKLKPQIKNRVIEAGLERFERNKFEKDLNKLIQIVFLERAKNINKEIDKLMIQWKADLQKKEKEYETIKNSHKSDLIREQRSELESIILEVDLLLTEISY